MLIVRHPPEKIKREYCCWNEVCSNLAQGAFLHSNYQNGIYSWEKLRPIPLSNENISKTKRTY
jgi:hypothetical protein